MGGVSAKTILLAGIALAPSVAEFPSPAPTITASPSSPPPSGSPSLLPTDLYWDDDWEYPDHTVELAISYSIAGCLLVAIFCVIGRSRHVLCACKNGCCQEPEPVATYPGGSAVAPVSAASVIPINVAPTTMIQVTVPTDAIAGSTMTATGPAGPITVTVPPGVKAGSSMSVMVPTTQPTTPVVQAMPVSDQQTMMTGPGAPEGQDGGASCFGGPDSFPVMPWMLVYGWVIVVACIFVPILWKLTCMFQCPFWAWVAVVKWTLLFVFVVFLTQKVRREMRQCYSTILAIVGTFLLLFCLCCCFDSDATVMRKDPLSNSIIQVPLHELRLGDEVLSLDPFTRKPFFEPVLAKAHYSFWDGGRQLAPMRTLELEAEPGRNTTVCTSITLSHTHFIYVFPEEEESDEEGKMAAPKLLHARDVRAGDRLLHYDPSTAVSKPVRVARIEPDVRRTKRAFFLSSPYVLVDNISASPYMGFDPAIAEWQHALFSLVARQAPNSAFLQAFVTITTVPFLLVNNAIQLTAEALQYMYTDLNTK